MINCDLHCHSTASDGALTPEDLVRRAAANGVTMLALTDHDNVSGIARGQQAAHEYGIDFVPGVEISITWEGHSIHIVGLGIDPGNTALATSLAKVREGRLLRGQRIAEDLTRVGIDDALTGALRYAQNPQLLSRAHFARYLVEKSYAQNVAHVFDHYLVPGKPGYVDHRWPDLAQAIDWIIVAGGVAVVAHPGRYRLSDRGMRRFLEAFKNEGGQAIEVLSSSHSPKDSVRFARLAHRFALFASCGSDFHAPDESCTDLGRLPPLPDDLRPVWQLF